MKPLPLQKVSLLSPHFTEKTEAGEGPSGSPNALSISRCPFLGFAKLQPPQCHRESP